MTAAHVPGGLVGEPSVLYLTHCQTGKVDRIVAPMHDCPSARFSPDGKTIATMGGEAIRLFDVETAKLLPVPETSSVNECVFSPDGKRIAWLSRFDRCIHYLDVATGKHFPSFEEPFSGAKGIAFSPDGNLIVSAYMTTPP